MVLVGESSVTRNGPFIMVSKLSALKFLGSKTLSRLCKTYAVQSLVTAT